MEGSVTLVVLAYPAHPTRNRSRNRCRNLWFGRCVSSCYHPRPMTVSQNRNIFCFAGNSSVTGKFPSQRQMTRSLDVFFNLRLNKRLCKQSWGWWLEPQLHPLWRHCNVDPKTQFTIHNSVYQHTYFVLWMHPEFLKWTHSERNIPIGIWYCHCNE